MLDTPEEIKVINQRLKDYFGVFENGESNFRVVWSDDLTEKRLTDQTDSGFKLTQPIMQEVPKYSYIKQRYILERIVPVPVQQLNDLTTKLSYEPIWVFEDAYGNALPPIWEAVNILIRTLLDQQLYKKGPYKLPEGEGNTAEEIEARVEGLEKVLFANETKIGDALATGSAVGAGEYRRNDSRFNNNPIKVH